MLNVKKRGEFVKKREFFKKRICQCQSLSKFWNVQVDFIKIAQIDAFFFVFDTRFHGRNEYDEKLYRSGQARIIMKMSKS